MSEGFEGVAFKVCWKDIDDNEAHKQGKELIDKLATALHGSNYRVAIMCVTKALALLINNFESKEEVYNLCMKVIKQYMSGEDASNEESS